MLNFDKDLRILHRLRPFILDAVDQQPDPEAVRSAAEVYGLRYALERQGPENTVHIVVGVAGQRLVGVDARSVGLVIDDDGSATYRPDELLDDDLLAETLNLTLPTPFPSHREGAEARRGGVGYRDPRSSFSPPIGRGARRSRVGWDTKARGVPFPSHWEGCPAKPGGVGYRGPRSSFSPPIGRGARRSRVGWDTEARGPVWLPAFPRAGCLARLRRLGRPPSPAQGGETDSPSQWATGA